MRPFKRARLTKARRHRQTWSGRGRLILWVAGIVVVVSAVIVAVLIFNDADVSPASSLSPDARWDDAWPPIPMTKRPAARPLEDVRAAYAFAARRPEVLRYIPCYCGCDHIERHESNLQCYTKPSQGTAGPVWDAHAFT